MVYLDYTLAFLGGLFILWCLSIRFGNSLRSVYNRYKIWPTVRWILPIVLFGLATYAVARIRGDI